MKILSKKTIVDYSGTRIIQLTLSAPQISQKALPGQFVVLMIGEKGERIPLTIVQSDVESRSIKVIFQETGFTTKALGALDTGDSLYALVGPLGHATEIKKYGKVILVGGGVGVAEIYPVAGGLKRAGNKITVIMGAKTERMLILKDELESIADEIRVVTDDGSCGEKGFTTDVLEVLLKKDKYDLIYAVGPVPMMRKISALGSSFKTRTIVSLNALMVDATGMCGCCRVTVGGEIKFSCVDGPEFQGDKVDWEELQMRNSMYLDKEKHICKLNFKNDASGADKT